MRDIMHEQLYNEETIQQAMDSEWVVIAKSGILDEIIPDEDEQNRIKKFFTDNYIELSDMYKFYSAVNSGGGTHTLEYIEVSKFLCKTNIFQTSDGANSNVILKIFLRSHLNGEETPNMHSEIRQPEFFVCIIKIALFKYITQTKKKLAILKKKGHEAFQAGLSKHKPPSPYEAVRTLYEQYLKPVIDKKFVGVAMKAVLGSDQVLLILHEHLDDLSAIFRLYAEFDGDDEADHYDRTTPNVAATTTHDADESLGTPGMIHLDDLSAIFRLYAEFDGDDEADHYDRMPNYVTTTYDADESLGTLGMMNIKEFGKFVNDAQFLGGRDLLRHEEEMTYKDVRQIFSASQHDTVSNEEELSLMQHGGQADSHQEQDGISGIPRAYFKIGRG
eukprot:CAMPEP_0172520794 /NCGR_PEP_ID=MMETSP1066-20121228/292208_1 /TAXON_ID=671091 /ORGANISM="Coscinodiscus wailesii, Strain CCMP2513" /LENGTH=387 /DNA_ID=CAMNT_0013303607 /DNA_START=1045 /DNA_END=2208 /DNA_ORIENTATION=-